MTQRRLINGTATAILALAAGGVFWSLGSVDSELPSAARPSADLATEGDADAGDRDAPQAASAPVDLNLALQKPLYEPPPPPPPKPRTPPVTAPKPVKPKKPKLDWSLAGTIIESKRSVAILTDASGKTDVRGAGEVVDLDPPGVLVRKIDSDAVTLEIDGDQTTLQLDRTSRRGGGAAAGKGREGRGNRRGNR